MQVPIEQVLRLLKKRWPNPGAMELTTPYRTLVGVLLSARTRDEQVLALLPGFFASFPTVDLLAQASVEQIERKINTIGMYRQKAKHLKHMATDVVHRFGGEIPSTMDTLITLAGVGRKTASVILVASFQTPAIAVDTHVHRVTNRLGWVKTTTPAQTEEALLKIIPDKWKPTVNRVFVKQGRSICIRTPRCFICPLKDVCAYKNKQLVAPKQVEDLLLSIEEKERRLEFLRASVL